MPPARSPRSFPYIASPSTLHIRQPSPFLWLGISCLLVFGCLTVYTLIGNHGKLLQWKSRRLILLKGYDDKHIELKSSVAKWNASDLSKDRRGWLLDPVAASARAGVSEYKVGNVGGATTCKAVHVGQIKPGTVRGNHRHLSCNETFIIWGAKTKFRLENHLTKKGYSEVVVSADEVAVVGGPAGLAHALVNIDKDKITYFIGCQDALIDAKHPSTEYNVWSGF